MQQNIYTLEKEMLREIEQRRRATLHHSTEDSEKITFPIGKWEVLVVTRTLVRIGPLVLAWDRH